MNSLLLSFQAFGFSFRVSLYLKPCGFISYRTRTHKNHLEEMLGMRSADLETTKSTLQETQQKVGGYDGDWAFHCMHVRLPVVAAASPCVDGAGAHRPLLNHARCLFYCCLVCQLEAKEIENAKAQLLVREQVSTCHSLRVEGILFSIFSRQNSLTHAIFVSFSFSFSFFLSFICLFVCLLACLLFLSFFDLVQLYSEPCSS